MLEALKYCRFLLRRNGPDEEGVTTVEYAVMLVLIALAVAAFGIGMAGSVTGVISRTIDLLNGAS